MPKWIGGIHRHPSGYYALVPNPKGGTGEREYFPERDEAEQWQDARGKELWGKDWPSIKRHGPRKRIISRDRKSKKNTHLEPGINIMERERPGCAGLERRVVATYMEMTTGGKRQRSRSFSFGSDASKYTLEEAIKKAREVRRIALKAYANH